MRLVHERVIKRAGFFFERRWIVGRFAAGRLEQILKSLLGEIRHGKPKRISRLVWRNLRVIDPGSVGITEEIVARLRILIHARKIKSPTAVF